MHINNSLSPLYQFSANLSVFIGDNYDRLCAQMKVIFMFQDVLEIGMMAYQPCLKMQMMHKGLSIEI
jgi:hypothetical protein